MIKLRKSSERGYADHGWLRSFHTFSFANYYDPAHIRFASLRVINEDWIAPGQGFGTHPHDNMEILTYVVSGELAHKDSMGNGRVIKAGEVQGMSAGTGVTHSEFNASDTETTHLLQIWIMPDKKGHAPSYSEWKPTLESDRQPLTLVASPDGASGSVRINQDAKMYVVKFDSANELTYSLDKNRHGWFQLIDGEIELNGQKLSKGDAAGISAEPEMLVKSGGPVRALFFDLG